MLSGINRDLAHPQAGSRHHNSALQMTTEDYQRSLLEWTWRSFITFSVRTATGAQEQLFHAAIPILREDSS